MHLLWIVLIQYAACEATKYNQDCRDTVFFICPKKAHDI